MSSPFRIAIIGCGRIATRHAEACLRARDAVLEALVDPAVERAESVAKEVGVKARIETSTEKILDSVDGAIIATPNHLHARIAIQCLEARIPVLIEKPLAVSVAEGEAICRASESAGVTAAVGYVTRFRKNVQLMRSLLLSDHFGNVRRFAYQTGTVGGWAPVSGYNLDRKATGGGVLVVTGTHFLDRMLHWFGYPQQVQLQQDSLGGPEANAFATFIFEGSNSKIRGVARFSKTVRMPTGFVMDTDAGTVLLGEGANDHIRLWPNGQAELELTIQQRDLQKSNGSQAADLFRLQLEDFISAVRTGQPAMVSVREGLQSLQLIEELYANSTILPGDWYNPTPQAAETIA